MKPSSPGGPPSATQTQGTVNTREDHPVHAHKIYCLAFQAIALQASCRNISCNAGFVYSLSPAGKGVIYAKKYAHFTWFSLVVAFSLGILLPAVTAGFFPLTTGMAAPLSEQTVHFVLLDKKKGGLVSKEKSQAAFGVVFHIYQFYLAADNKL